MQTASLTRVAAELARTTPRLWGEFLKALGERVESRKDECIGSPVEVVQVTQGRAQEIASLFALLRDAVRNADRIADLKERRSSTSLKEFLR